MDGLFLNWLLSKRGWAMRSITLYAAVLSTAVASIATTIVHGQTCPDSLPPTATSTTTTYPPPSNEYIRILDIPAAVRPLMSQSFHNRIELHILPGAVYS